MRFKIHLNESASRTTALQETLFAVGLAIHQLKGSVTVEYLTDGNIFTKAFDKYVETDVMVGDVFLFATEQPAYVKSVISSVNALKSSKYSPSRSSNIYRGRGMMKTVYDTAFVLLAKEGERMQSDKWNPGDVWASTKSTLPNFEDINALNMYIRKGIEDGYLTPISLKKTKNAKVSYIKQSSDIVFPTYKGIKKPSTPFNTGVIINTTDKNLSIDLRSFNQHGAASVTTELLMKKSDARHGKATPSKLIKYYNIPQTSLANFKKMSDDTEVMKDRIVRLWADLGYNFSEAQVNKHWVKRETNKEFVRNPVGYWRSIINSLEIAIHLKQNAGMRDDFVQDTVKRAFSTSSVSSDFLKIY